MTGKKQHEVAAAENALRHGMASEIHYAMSLRRISTATLARETEIAEPRLVDLLSGRARERLDFNLAEISRIGEFLGHYVNIEFVPADTWAPTPPPLDATGKQIPMFEEAP
jgi:hypothetical protein